MLIRLLKYCFGKVGEITSKLREFLKSETNQTLTLYKDEGRLVVDLESQHTASGLVPTEGLDDKSAADHTEDSDEIMMISESKKKDLFDLAEMKKALDN